MIVAHDLNRAIGFEGSMPWGTTFKSDLKWFKQHTTNKIVVMGRKTFESIGKPLPNRTNVILTSSTLKAVEHDKQIYHVAHSVDEVLNEWVLEDRETFIIGGSEVYNQFLPYADRLYITHIESEFEGDAYFPMYNANQYSAVYDMSMMENEHMLRFKIYDRIIKQKI
ncbi:dihydrofolate reductase [Paenibacillus xylaniclasticus]|uniref:dihydrofolate reductase n=1 Tax=Paenibacillus xylaniclasticus TaxID=588083 RepID=UPI001FE6296E|nr:MULTISPECIES: dihydrofolate reductase [Paenibacillus]